MVTALNIQSLTGSKRYLLAASALLASAGPVPAGTTLEELIIVPDVLASGPLGGGEFLIVNDSVAFRFNVDSGEVTGPLFILDADGSSSLENRMGVDAFHAASGWFSIDIQAEVTPVSESPFFIRPGEIYDPSGTPQFDPTEAGLPQQVNIDAIARDPATDDLLFSIDRSLSGVSPSAQIILPADVYRWDGSSLNLAFDGFAVPRSANLDGLAMLTNQHLLMSFDTPGTTLVDPVSFDDNDVLEFDPDSNSFEVVFQTPFTVADGGHAGVAALSADELLGGTIRFTQSFRQVQEDIGFLVLTIERIDNSEGAIVVEFTTVDGTATDADGDFDGFTNALSWDDGETGDKTLGVTINDDDEVEATFEHFEVVASIAEGTATLGDPSSVTIEIIDNDGDLLFADGFES